MAKRSRFSGEPNAISNESGELHRLLVDAVQDYAIFALDRDGFILSWNTGAQALKGYTPEEAIGQHFSIFYPPDLVAEGFPEFELRTAASVGRFENEGWRLRKDGARFWANVIITALRSSTGSVTGFAKVTRDLTERRKADESLRASEEGFRLLVEGVKDYAIFMLDPAGYVASWNDGAERIKGYRRDEIIGRHLSTFYLPEDVASRKPERELEIALRTGKYEEEGWRSRKDGTAFWANVLITTLRNPAGTLIGFSQLTRDLTERLTAHAAQLEARSREAQEAQRRADDANRAKGQFLAAMSHELRTPLNAIGGFADLLAMGLSGTVTVQQADHLGRIKRSQQHLLGIINDILNFSRVEAGYMTYDFAPVALDQVIEGVMQMVAPQLEARALRFEHVIQPRGIVAWADQAKVEQILLNLVSNSMKFTAPGGRIGLSCGWVDARRVAISVRDTGCGISSRNLESIFEPFVQVGRSLTSTQPGTGLGLAISRDLARAMHGELTVESDVDSGSTFTLMLPTFDASTPSTTTPLPLRDGRPEPTMPA